MLKPPRLINAEQNLHLRHQTLHVPLVHQLDMLMHSKQRLINTKQYVPWGPQRVNTRVVQFSQALDTKFMTRIITLALEIINY